MIPYQRTDIGNRIYHDRIEDSLCRFGKHINGIFIIITMILIVIILFAMATHGHWNGGGGFGHVYHRL